MAEVDPELNSLSEAVIGAAIEVHRGLGPGFLEQVYESALCFELELRNVPFTRQPVVEVGYKGRAVGESRLDLLVAGRLVVELKSVETLLQLHSMQLLSYLRITGHQLGLLINFNVPRLRHGIKRVVLTR